MALSGSYYARSECALRRFATGIRRLASHTGLLVPVVFILAAACTSLSSAPPTPAPFPISGVRQLSYEYAHFQDLMWSPAGDLIAATRCPVFSSQPLCFQNEETVLIEPTDGSLQAIDFSPLSSNQITGYPVFWAPNGEKLVLYVREQVPQQDGESFEDQYRYLVYTPSTATFDEIALTGIAVGMGPAESEALIFRSDGTDGISLGWLNLDTGKFQGESAVVELSEGPYALSPNYKFLLQGDSSDNIRCRDINSLSIGSDSGFQPLISLGCYPAWSQDGSKLAYAAKGDPDFAPNRLLIANADGSGSVSIFGEERIADLAYPTWSPQGSFIAFTKGGPSGSNAIYVTEIPSGKEY